MDMERFKSYLKGFAEKLRECGEVKAAEAVETVLKYVNGCTK